MCKRVLFTLLFFTALMAQAQGPAKMSIGLMHQVNAIEESSSNITLLAKGIPHQIRTAVQANGGTFHYYVGDICRVTLPADKIEAFSSANYVTFVDNALGKLFALGDMMLMNNRIDSVHAGAYPLPNGFDGEGVVVGVIDLGIDYTHADFKDSSGVTRIKYIWDQNLETDGTEPATYQYGVVCDSASIMAGGCGHVDPNFYYSHGTSVAGIAAGNGLATGKYKGVAPKADIIAVSLNFDDDFLGHVADAIHFIYQKANEMGKPCVINTSVGTYAGSHDGQDLTTQIIENMLEAQSGRVLVAASGNAGNVPFHIGMDVPSPAPGFFWFEEESVLGDVAFFEFWADSADLTDVNFAIGANEPTTYVDRGQGMWHNILSGYSIPPNGIDSTSEALYDGTELLGTIKTYAQLVDGRYNVQVLVNPAVANQLWRFEAMGSGYLDAWSHPSYTETSTILSSDELPSADTYPDIVHYVAPDSSMSVVSSWQCSEDVITVGSYWNRDTMTNYYGGNPPISGTLGQRITSSSTGPTRDGRIKPDISASGQWVLATASSSLSSWLIGVGAATYIADGGQHYLQGGTSFSSPIVAGAAALYLQANPDADYSEVKSNLLNGARSDSFTGTDLPNNLWGHGKLDVYNAIVPPYAACPTPTGVQVTHVLDTAVRIVWNAVPGADGYELLGRKAPDFPWRTKFSLMNYTVIEKLKPAKTYHFKIRAACSATDTSLYTYQHSFTTLASREGDLAKGVAMSIGPNPLIGTRVLNLGWSSTESFNEGSFELYDAFGSKVIATALRDVQGQAQIGLEHLAPGVYIYRTAVDGQLLETGKLAVQ